MSDRVNHELRLAFTRRTLFGSAAVTGILAGVTPAAVASTGNAAHQPQNRSRTHVVLLGTGGGPGWNPGATRAGISSALVVGEKFYVIDAGEGVGRQIRNAKLGDWESHAGGPLNELQAVFLTHLHSDHISDIYNLFNFGLFAGIRLADLPVHLYGPGSRGALAPLAGGAASPPVVAPENPTPGTYDLWQNLVRAYAQDFNDRARDNRMPVPDQFVQAHDIDVPAFVGSDPNSNPHPRMDPFHVYEDDRVKVTATLVQHAPVFPAFAYRFDTEDGSVVFSGDTGPSENLVQLAENADVLVHEVISRQFVEQSFPEPRTASQQAVMDHLLGAHTTIEQVGPIAESAGAKVLALNHMVPQNWPDHLWKEARNGFSGRLIVGQDLDVINVGG